MQNFIGEFYFLFFLFKALLSVVCPTSIILNMEKPMQLWHQHTLRATHIQVFEFLNFREKSNDP